MDNDDVKGVNRPKGGGGDVNKTTIKGLKINDELLVPDFHIFLFLVNYI